jgi:hypothetical protein
VVGRGIYNEGGRADGETRAIGRERWEMRVVAWCGVERLRACAWAWLAVEISISQRQTSSGESVTVGTPGSMAGGDRQVDGDLPGRQRLRLERPRTGIPREFPASDGVVHTMAGCPPANALIRRLGSSECRRVSFRRRSTALDRVVAIAFAQFWGMWGSRSFTPGPCRLQPC